MTDNWREGIATAEDAHAFVRALSAALAAQSLQIDEPPSKSDFNSYVFLFQSPETREAARALRSQGLPVLAEIFDQYVEEAIEPAQKSERELLVAVFKNEGPFSNEEDDQLAAKAKRREHIACHLLAVIKQLAIYGRQEDVERIARAAQAGIGQDHFLWTVIFQSLGHHLKLVREFSERVATSAPSGFIRVAYLDLVNRAAVDGELDAHPFDTEDYIAWLRELLINDDPQEYSYAVSATVALPFLEHEAAAELFDLACEHPSIEVRIEAAWGLARRGDAAGIEALAQMALDPNISQRASTYLRELDHAEAIPEETNDPTFQAKAEMAQWLAHPQEFGCAPNALELYDHRHVYWPPTDDERPVWLFKYTYTHGEEVDTGVGMVGSVTFALFGETTAHLPPEHVYALHCCWELAMHQDPRAPKERSIEAGLELLGLD